MDHRYQVDCGIFLKLIMLYVADYKGFSGHV